MSLTEYRVGDKGIWHAGRDFERERIIKLLEESLIYDEPVVIQRNQLIELIKGESQKDNETVVLLAEGENK